MIRLNIFLPFFRKRKKSEPPREPPTGIWAPLLSDRESGRKGLIRKVLKGIGETWLSSPWRRVVQAAFFLLFVVLFVYVAWPYGGTNYAEHRESKEHIAAELFLIIDPLVSLSTAIAAKSWIWSLTAAGVILAICIFVPRGFCGYVCPLGTTIDLFDWAIGKRIKRWKLKDQNRGCWVNLKYHLLVGCLVASIFGVLFTGFVAALPVITRAFLFLVK